mgnify:CR=1 FL=1|tara:strand:+ start:661 stop:1329 length:669 start_codon:yes stop_codon:yes gene_type:complete
MAISKFNYNSFNITPVASKVLGFNANADGFTTASGSSMILIKTLTASSSGTLSFVNGSSDVVLDDTYPVYKFQLINIHPATDGAEFLVNFRDGSTAYDATKTTTKFSTYHQEDNGESSSDRLAYQASGDLAQGTGFQQLSNSTGNAGDENTSGEMFLFNPSSTTFVKHFIARTSSVHDASAIQDHHVAGYCNVTAAIDAVQFKFNSGNIDAGVIKLYGIADS